MALNYLLKVQKVYNNIYVFLELVLFSVESVLKIKQIDFRSALKLDQKLMQFKTIV